MSPFYDSAVFVFDDLLNFLFESYALGPGSSFYILRVTGLLMRFVLPSILLGQAFCEKFIFPIFSHEAVKLKLCSALRMLSMSCFFARSTACITPFISFFFSFLFSYFSNSTCSLMNSFSPLWSCIGFQCCFSSSIWSSYAATHGKRFYGLYDASS